MKLLANGCSFTDGDNTWPQQLVENGMFVEVHNLSMAGGSNDRIVRTTLDFCSKNDMSNYMAVIQWTSLFRKEYYNANLKEWIGGTTVLNNNSPEDLSMAVTVEKGSTTRDKDLVHISNAATEDMMYLQSITDYRLSTLKNILILQNYFEQHNIKYLFTSMGPDSHIAGNMFTHMYSPQKQPIIHILESAVNKNNWTKLSIANMLNNDLEYIISQDDTHPNEKGHKLLAQSFWQQIGKIYG